MLIEEPVMCTYLGLIRPWESRYLVAVGLDKAGVKRVLGCRKVNGEIGSCTESLLEQIKPLFDEDHRHLFIVCQLEGIVGNIYRRFGRSQPIQLCRDRMEAMILEAVPKGRQRGLKSKLRQALSLGETDGMARVSELLAARFPADHPIDPALMDCLKYCFTLERLNVAPTELPELRSVSVVNRIELSLRKLPTGAGTKGSPTLIDRALSSRKFRNMRVGDAFEALLNSLKSSEPEGQNGEISSASTQPVHNPTRSLPAVAIERSECADQEDITKAADPIENTSSSKPGRYANLVRIPRPPQNVVRYLRGPLKESAKQLVDRIPRSLARIKSRYEDASRNSDFKSELHVREASKLVDRLFFVPGDIAPKSVTFLGVDSVSQYGPLCTGAAELLARRLSDDVCVVDASLHAAGLHHEYGLSDSGGLCAALLDPVGCLAQARRHREQENLWVLPRGDIRQLADADLTWDRIRTLITELQRNFEYLLIHAPPAPGLLDGVLLGNMTDGVVLVVEADVTRKHGLGKTTRDLADSNVRVLAAVLNQRQYPIPNAIYDRLFGTGARRARYEPVHQHL